MLARVVAGIVGGIAGVVPLVAMSLAGFYGVLDAADAQVAVLLGAGALLSGVLLGGVVAGLIVGRRGGASAGLVSGLIAAALYAVAVIGLVVGGARQGYGPPIVALHPLRTSGALIFVAGLLLGVTLIVSWLVGRTRAEPPHGTGGSHHGSRSPYEVGAAVARPDSTSGAYFGPTASRERSPSAERPPVGAPPRPPAGRSAPRNWQ